MNVIRCRGKVLYPKGHASLHVMLFGKWLAGITDNFPHRWRPANPHNAALPKQKEPKP